MRKLGTLTGEGSLTLSDGTATAVTYRIDVTEIGATKSGAGMLEGDPSIMMVIAHSTDSPVLTLSDGRTLDVRLRRTRSDGTADILSSGPIPGF